ncbi:MAG TPA: isocitrate lyase, partial [Candidatus Methylomirabilis sp.]|nr:isocitrate lyase [Candidatus Methylomirabilis sp.]
MDKAAFIEDLQRKWAGERWRGIQRPYAAADVYRLRGSVAIEYSLAKLGAQRLWRLLHEDPYVPVLSAVTGNQAIQEVAAGLKGIYVSGWQAAADMNEAMQMYPDQ